MRNKTYSLYGKAVDSYGIEHIVTVVGEFEQFKEEIEVVRETRIEVKENKLIDATLTHKDRVKVRTISFGYSICHPDDEFDKEYGIELAKKRAMKNPVGKLSTVDISMLTTDMCNMLVFGELTHILNNIDRYVD